MPRYFLAILDTMWGDDGVAPHWFPINPDNHSGRRLYRLTGARDWDVWVANACPQQTSHARLHGTPSPAWLRSCFSRIKSPWQDSPLLVCGKVAQATYDEMIAICGKHPPIHRGPVIRIMHPAARTWTKLEIARVQRLIRRSL
jgi:hypothetical protein